MIVVTTGLVAASVGKLTTRSVASGVSVAREAKSGRPPSANTPLPSDSMLAMSVPRGAPSSSHATSSAAVTVVVPVGGRSSMRTITRGTNASAAGSGNMPMGPEKPTPLSCARFPADEGIVTVSSAGK